MDNFSDEVVKKIAKLARIKIAPQEIELYAQNLNEIFNVIEELKTVDTKNIEPLISITNEPLFMRKDEVNDGGYANDILPKESKYNCYSVPKVIE